MPNDAGRSGEIDRLRPREVLTWLAVGVVLVAGAVFLHPRQIRWDGAYYYGTLRSLVIDHDFDLSNEARRLDWPVPTESEERLADGMLPNPFPIGAPLLWMPFFGATHVVCRAFGRPDCDGYSAPYLWSVLIGTVFWVCAGAALNAAALRRLMESGGSRLPSTCVLTLVLGSPLIFYTLFEGDYAHGDSYFASALVLYLVVALAEKAPSDRSAILSGVAVGLVALVRWQEATMAILPLGLVVLRSGRDGSRAGLLGERLRRTLLFGTSAFLLFTPQLALWKSLYGTFFLIPQGNDFLSLRHVEPVAFFFSTWNGVFLWHPLLLLALIGFALSGGSFFPGWAGDGRRLRTLAVLALGLDMLVCMMAEDWWSGGAFGQRRLVGALPLFSLGLGNLWVLAVRSGWRLRYAGALALGLLVGWNVLALLRYRQGFLPYNPADPGWYQSGIRYERYEYSRRAADIWTGARP